MVEFDFPESGNGVPLHDLKDQPNHSAAFVDNFHSCAVLLHFVAQIPFAMRKSK